MLVSVSLVISLSFVHFTQCSTIITRSMIRSPNYSRFQSREEQTQSVLPEPELLMSTSNHVTKKYQKIYPTFSEEERTNFERDMNASSKEVKQNNSYSISQKDFVNEQSDVSKDQNHKVLDHETKKQSSPAYGITKTTDNFKNNTLDETTLQPITTTISPQEVSKLHWEQYTNLSSDIFKNTYKQNRIAVPDEKGFNGLSIWEILQRLFTCSWEEGLISCMQDTLRDAVSGDSHLLHFLSPRLPNFELDDSPISDNLNNNKMDYQITEQDEGRKRTKRLQVIQVLQFLLPLLLAIKMSMLPALAVMVLVTGKAFFMSLLSLGAAIFSFFLQSSGLAANKRHEIAPQPPLTHDQDPNKYYYVM